MVYIKSFLKYKEYNLDLINDAKERISDLKPTNENELEFVTNFHLALEKVSDSNCNLEHKFEDFNFHKDEIKKCRN